MPRWSAKAGVIEGRRSIGNGRRLVAVVDRAEHAVRSGRTRAVRSGSVVVDPTDAASRSRVA